MIGVRGGRIAGLAALVVAAFALAAGGALRKLPVHMASPGQAKGSPLQLLRDLEVGDPTWITAGNGRTLPPEHVDDHSRALSDLMLAVSDEQPTVVVIRNSQWVDDPSRLILARSLEMARSSRFVLLPQ